MSQKCEGGQAITVRGPAHKLDQNDLNAKCGGLMMRMHAVDPRAELAIAGERAHVMLAVATSANVLQSILVIGFVCECFYTGLITNALIRKTFRLSITGFETGK